MFKNGLSQCATVQAGAHNAWDSHTNNFTNQTATYESLFDGLSRIISYAQTLGIDNNLGIVVVSELGRSPILNSTGGKDHWPYTSALLWGKGLKVGTVVGKSDATLRGIKISPRFGTTDASDVERITIQHVFAALFLKYGILKDLILPGVVPLSPIVEVT